MKYTAYLNNDIFFDTSSSLKELSLIKASASLKTNAAGTFTFELPPQNIKYGDFDLLVDWVKLYRDDDLIFYGRVYSRTMDINICEKIVCEGVFSVFNDTIISPFEHDGSLLELITELLRQHNLQAGSDKQIVKGTISITDSKTYRSYSNYVTTMDRLEDLIDIYGGYMRIRVDGNILYLDWLNEAEASTSSQTIDFGNNLLDITKADDADGIITYLIPIGAEIENADGTKSKLDITSVSTGGVNYISSATGEALYGKIWGTHEWEDVTVPANLLTKAQAYLNAQLTRCMSINVKAVDLAMIEQNERCAIAGKAIAGLAIVGTGGIHYFKIGEKITVNSSIHGINGQQFVCKQQTLNLLNPASDSMQLGSTVSGLVWQNSNNNNQTIKIIQNINNNYAPYKKLKDTEDGLNQTIEARASSIMAVIEADEQKLESCVTQTVFDDYKAETQSTYFDQYANKFDYLYEKDGVLDSWFSFEANKFTIGTTSSPIKSVQTNESYQFVNVDNENDVLLEINTEGIISETVNVNGQVTYKQGSTNQWATRKGKYKTGVGVNLDDVWIG